MSTSLSQTRTADNDYCPSPYDFLPKAPTFTLTSNDVKEGETLQHAQLSQAFGVVEKGGDVAPHLQWSGMNDVITDEIKSYVVTCFDPDAPTVSGFWHWCVYDIPANVTEITSAEKLPEGAKTLKNDAGFAGFCGAAPPPGHHEHRYIFCVTALPVESLPIEAESATPAVCHFNMFGAGILGRAFLTAKYGR